MGNGIPSQTNLSMWLRTCIIVKTLAKNFTILGSSPYVLPVTAEIWSFQVEPMLLTWFAQQKL